MWDEVLVNVMLFRALMWNNLQFNAVGRCGRLCTLKGYINSVPGCLCPFVFKQSDKVVLPSSMINMVG